MLLSILIPVYNEEEFVTALLERVVNAPLPDGMERELVVVDDSSRDRSVEMIEDFSRRHPNLIRLFLQTPNQGKGAALRRAIQEARGEYAIIQDADLEYDPREYPRILAPLIDGRADAVYGSRFVVAGERRVLYFWHALANHMLTTMCNVVSDLNLTDMETCYKAFRMSLLKSIPLRSNRFGFEPEITIKLSKRQARIYETPISYHGRTYEEGKKIGLKDAFDALYVITRFALSNDIYSDEGQEILHSFSGAPKFNRWLADTIRPYLGESVLEVGAGIGNLTRLLVKGRKHYVASDLDDEHLGRLQVRLHQRPNLAVHVVNAETAAHFEPFHGQMDTVVCLNVVEHLADDVGALRNFYSALAPGGRAVILVPEGPSIFGTLDEALGHYRRYTDALLRQRMEEAGFEVEHMLFFNRVSRPGWYVNGKILKRRLISPFQLSLINRTVGLWRKVDRFLPWKPTSLIAIGRKP